MRRFPQTAGEEKIWYDQPLEYTLHKVKMFTGIFSNFSGFKSALKKKSVCAFLIKVFEITIMIERRFAAYISSTMTLKTICKQI